MYKNITKLVILCLVAGFSFSACKKSSDNKPVYSMKLTINGNTMTYTTCTASKLNVDGIIQFNIIGTNKGNESLAMVVFADLGTVKSGQTFNAMFSEEQNNLTMIYNDGTNNQYITQFINPKASLTITSITSTTLTGKFSGNLYYSDDFNATNLVYTISNGTFVAQVSQ